MIVTKRFPVANGFNNVFDDLFGTLQSSTKAENFLSVPINIIENEKGYDITFNAPGRNKEAFKISVDNGLLTVSYEKAAEPHLPDQKFVRKEFENGSFKRSFNLDEKLNADEIQAKYENGVLNIFVPKKQLVQKNPTHISIQ